MAEARLDIKVVGSEKLRQTAKDFVNLSKEANLTKEKYSALGAAQLRMVEANKKLTTTLATLKKLYDEGKISLDSYNKAKYEAERQAREFIKTDKNLIAVERERKKSLEEAQKAQRRASEEADRARQKHDQLYAAEVRLTKATQELAMAVKGGGMAQERADAQLEMLTKDYHLWIQAVESGNYAMINSGNQFARFSDEVFRAQQRVKRFASVGLQQAGYQVQDFIVQIQSGQSALVAFGQQGSQLAGIFGTKGPWIGAAIAGFTGAAMLINSFTSEAKKKLDELAKKSEETFKNLKEQYRAASLGVTEEELGFIDKLAAQQLKYAKATEDLVKMQAVQARASSKAGYRPGPMEDQVEFLKRAQQEEAKILSQMSQEYQDFLDVRTKLLDQAISLDPFGGPGPNVASQEERDAVRAENLQKELAYMDQVISAHMDIYDAQVQMERDAYAHRQQLAEESLAIDLENMETLIDSHMKMYDAQTENQKIAYAERERLLQEEAIAVEKTLDALFKNRTLYFNIRFSDEEQIMGQSLTPAKIDSRKGDWKKLLAMGWTRENLLNMGYKEPTRRGGGKSEAETFQDKINKLVEQIAKERELLGLTEAQQKIVQALGSDYKKAGADVLKSLEDQINQQLRLNERLKTTQEIFDTISSAASQGFMAMVEGTKTVKDAFRDMAREIIKKLYEVLVVQRLVGSFNAQSGQGSGLVGLLGSALTGTPLLPAPAAAPAIGKTASTSNIAPVVVNQSFSFAANGDESVKRIIAQSAPQIAQMTQKQIMDSRRRGGQMKATFS